MRAATQGAAIDRDARRASRQGPRLVHVVRRLGVGGLEVGVVNVVAGLDRLGFEQAVCCLEDRGELAGGLPDSVPVWACAEGGRVQRLPWQAARHLRGWRPDVVHARNGSSWIDAATAWLLAGRPGRLAFGFHGWDETGRMPRRRALAYRGLARITAALAAVSAEAARDFAAEAGIEAGRFNVLASGVDTERFRPPEAPRRGGGRVVIGCVGRLDPIKAIDVLIDAFARVVEDAPGSDPELRLLGDGPERPELERRARHRGVAERVRFLGMVQDVPGRLREIDLFVLPSLREGRPTSIMEAMAAGLPVVATRVGSIPALVDEGRTGLLVEPGDAPGLALAIGRLVSDPALRRRFSEEARRVAVSELSLERMVDRYAEFYREIGPPGRR